MLHELLYTSFVPSPMADAELDALLAQARAANRARDVGGILVYRNRTFLQLLEGPHAAVTRTFERVRRDQRHTHVRVVVSGPIDRRNFPEWSMAFHRLDRGAVPPGWQELGAPEVSGTMATELLRGLRADLADAPDFDHIA